MKRDLDQLFDQCISQLNSGVDIEAILESYPEEAAELRPLLRTVALIREVPQPAASAKARARGKRRLLRAVAAKKQAKAEVGSRTGRILGQVAAWLQPWLQPQACPERSEWAPMRRLAVTIATLLVVITMTGWSVTLVAANSLPDSPLYPVKLATEQIRLTLATSSTARAQIQLDRAERRFDEVQTLIETGRGAHEAVLRAAQHQSRLAWEAISQTPEEARELLLSDFGSWAQKRQAALKEAKTQLPPKEQAVLDETIEALSVEIELAEKALRWPSTPAPATETPTAPPTVTDTATHPLTATRTATTAPMPTFTRAPATPTPAAKATSVPPTATATEPSEIEVPPMPVTPIKALPTPTATATTPKDITATPTHPLTATTTPSVIPPTATPTEHSEIEVPPMPVTPLATATPTPDEPPVGQPPVPVATVPLLSTPTP